MLILLADGKMAIMTHPNQSFAGCTGPDPHAMPGIRWFAAPCDARNLSGLRGNVSVLTPEPRVCSTENLGVAAARLRVTCSRARLAP